MQVKTKLQVVPNTNKVCSCGKCIGNLTAEYIGTTYEKVNSKQITIHWWNCLDCKSTVMDMLCK